jgi:hypothetical protein
MSARTGIGRQAATTIVAIVTSAVWLVGGVAAAEDPPGNNGTVKVAGDDVMSGNDVHVGCAFTIDFYGFDEGELYADLTIEGQAPSEAGLLWLDRVDIGEDAAGGGTDLDASAPVDLEGAFSGAPHVEQGFHVKLTIHADGSQGADTKHKTFWVDCAGVEGE